MLLAYDFSVLEDEAIYLSTLDWSTTFVTFDFTVGFLEVVLVFLVALDTDFLVVFGFLLVDFIEFVAMFNSLTTVGVTYKSRIIYN